jgi:diadenosine tetraphosphate (Ap4A) HIT family hydrolase
VSFVLDPRIEADSAFVADLALCQLRLMDDSRFPWLVLIPQRDGLVEIIDLPAADRTALMAEIAHCSSALRAAAPCQKLNIGALGNVVPQLHVHVVARRRDDAAWPGPVWGAGARRPYADDARARLIRKIRAALDAPVGRGD